MNDLAEIGRNVLGEFLNKKNLLGIFFLILLQFIKAYFKEGHQRLENIKLQEGKEHNEATAEKSETPYFKATY